MSVSPGTDSAPPPDPRQVQAFLTQRLGPGVSDTAPLGAGAWSQAYSFRLSGADYVIRIGDHGEDYAKDARIAMFSSPDLPIPRVLEFGEGPGWHFAISERVFGAMLDLLDADEMRRTVPAVCRMWSAAREVDLGWSTGYGMWRADGTAPCAAWTEFLLQAGEDPSAARCHGWRERLATSPLGDGPFEEAFASMERLVPFCPEERHLLHTDLLNRNVLVSAGRITGVIDWGNAIVGDFLYELAMFTLWAPWFASMEGIDWAAEARRCHSRVRLDVPHFEERLRCYELHIGLVDIGYSAFVGNWDQLRWIAERTLELARSAPG